MRVLVTGSAGFIGFHVAKSLLERGEEVIGIDVVNDYYDVGIKHARLNILEETAKTTGGLHYFVRGNLADTNVVNTTFEKYQPDRVIHLAAQAGIRYSIDNPHAYVESNLVAFTNVLEACRNFETRHLVYASTSSVYGANAKTPYSEHHGANHPLQFYAATKRANELMAHAYSHLFDLPTTALRFFTVYGPWGRPDMALHLFTKNIIAGKPIKVFNQGLHARDFTYIDDIVEGVLRITNQPATADPDWDSNAPDPASSNAPYRIFNIGNNEPIQLTAYIEAIERALGRKAVREMLPLQPGDALSTHADVTDLVNAVNYKPATPLEQGVEKFVDWYQKYYAEESKG